VEERDFFHFFENIYKKIKKKSLEELENYTKNERM